MIDDLAARVAVATSRIGEAVQEIERRLDDLNSRRARFASVGGNILASSDSLKRMA